MTTFGITGQGFVLKRLADILASLQTRLSTVQDPITLEYLTAGLADENDPLVQVVNAVADELSVCWEQVELAYNQFNPLAATGVGLQSLVQLNGFTSTGESDSDLRVKQQQLTSLTAFRQVDSIYAAVVNVPGVLFCRVCVNSTVSTDYRGLSGKSVACVVVGGETQAVCDAIFSKSPLGLNFYGNTTGVSLDAMGNPYTILYEVPTAVPILMTVNLSVLDYSRWPTNGVQMVSDALVAYSQYGLTPYLGLPPGVSVINSALYSPINTVPGVKIVSVLMSRSGTPIEQDLAIQWNEVAQITTANITVNLV